MIAFSFNAALEMIMTNEQNGGKSKVEETKFSLGASENLRQDVYLRPDGMPTPEGVKIFTMLLAQGIVGVIKFAEKEGYPNAAACLSFFQSEIERTLSIEAEVTTGTMQIPGQTGSGRPKTKSTSKELVEELRDRNKIYQYDWIIRKALANMYHDFKVPLEQVEEPKTLLVADLSQHPELSDIRQRVIDGEFDEKGDDEDRKEIAKTLFNDQSDQTAEKIPAKSNVPYSPKLKVVMDKIKQTIYDNDVGALVVLHTPGFSEYFYRIDPPYACVTLDRNRVHVRARLKEDFNGDKEAQSQKIANTMNMLSHLSQTGVKTAMAVGDVLKHCEKTVHVQNTDSTYTPENPDLN